MNRTYNITSCCADKVRLSGPIDSWRVATFWRVTSSCGIEIIDCVQVSTTSSPHRAAGNKWAEAAEFKNKNMNAGSITHIICIATWQCALIHSAEITSQILHSNTQATKLFKFQKESFINHQNNVHQLQCTNNSCSGRIPSLFAFVYKPPCFSWAFDAQSCTQQQKCHINRAAESTDG